MFDNIGGKIKTLAQVICLIGIICSVISGIVMMGNDLAFLGFIIIIIGSLVSWVSSFTLYGFGELVENSEIANSNIYKIHKLLTKIAVKEEKEPVKKTKTPYFSPTTPTVKKTPDGGWVCKKCGSKNISTAQFCKDCGSYK